MQFEKLVALVPSAEKDDGSFCLDGLTLQMIYWVGVKTVVPNNIENEKVNL